jgi:hypothetical protein
MMMARKSNNGTKVERLTITLATGQKRKLRALATQHRTSLSTVVRWALDAYVASNATDGARGREPKTRNVR